MNESELIRRHCSKPLCLCPYVPDDQLPISKMIAGISRKVDTAPSASRVRLGSKGKRVSQRMSNGKEI